MAVSNGRPTGGQAVVEGGAWGAIHRLLSVQVYGADEASGREVAIELLRAGHPLTGLQLFGTQAHATTWHGHSIRVHAKGPSLSPADLAFVCAGPAEGAELVPRLLAAGTRVIDLSGAAKRDPEVPLVVGLPGGGHAEDMGTFTQLVALPARSSVALVAALRLLDGACGLASIGVSASIAAVSEGMPGVHALREELRARSRAETGAAADPGIAGTRADAPGVAGRIGNLRPAVGEAPGSTPEAFEAELLADVRRTLGRVDLPVGVVAFEGDRERCDAFEVRVVTQAPLDASACAALFQRAPGFRVHGGAPDPLPQACRGTEEIHLGRIRAGSGGPGSLCFFLVADQLRAGAATVALRVGAHLLSGGP